jgi:hypothetical protein
MRKTFEALQCWRRSHGGAYPYRLSDLVLAGLMPRDSGICPSVLRELMRSDPSHHLVTSRGPNGDPTGSYEYELSASVIVERKWLPQDAPPYTRQQLKAELLRRPFHEQVPILRCTSHRASAPAELSDESSAWRNLSDSGIVYWSGDLWEQRWLADVPYCCRDANVLFGLKGPPFHSGRAPGLANALDLRPWVCAFGDHAWWWNYPLFKPKPNWQTSPQLNAFFQNQPGRVLDLAGVQWWIDGLVQLQGRIATNASNPYGEPGLLAFVWERIGLHVGRKCGRASWLQGTVWTAPPGEAVAWLIWHYVDGMAERVPIIYGKTTARFWGDVLQIENEHEFPEPVWRHHESAETAGTERWLRIYQQSWNNPRPNVTVATLDFISNRSSPAAPFLIALDVFR